MVDKLVTIATFDTLVDASFAKDLLETEGVKVFLADSAAVEVAWHLTSAIGGIKLQVMDADAGRAVSILKSNDPELVQEGGLQPEASENSVHGQETYDDLYESETDELVDRALRAAKLGMVFLPLQVYSLWLLLQIKRDGERLSPENRRRVRTALLLDLLVIVVLGILYAGILHILFLFLQ